MLSTLEWTVEDACLLTGGGRSRVTHTGACLQKKEKHLEEEWDRHTHKCFSVFFFSTHNKWFVVVSFEEEGKKKCKISIICFWAQFEKFITNVIKWTWVKTQKWTWVINEKDKQLKSKIFWRIGEKYYFCVQNYLKTT